MIMFIALCQTFGLIVNAVLPLSRGFVWFNWGVFVLQRGVRPTLVVSCFWVLNTAEAPASVAVLVEPPAHKTDAVHHKPLNSKSVAEWLLRLALITLK